jgi:hypothetical protein
MMIDNDTTIKKNSNTSSSDDDDEEETRRFRVQCAAVATSLPHQGVGKRTSGGSSQREKMLGSDTIAKALEAKVDGTLVFVVSDLDGTSAEEKPKQGMQLFRRGPTVSKTLPVGHTSTHTALGGGGGSNTTTKKKKKNNNNNNNNNNNHWLPAHRMIDHERLFSTQGCIDKGVIVQGDILLQKKLHHQGRMTVRKQKGIVVETIRSKARLRQLKKSTTPHDVVLF